MMSRRIHTTTVVVGVVDNASDKMGYLALADTRKKHMYVLVHYTTAFIYNRVRNLSIIVISNIYFFITKFEERINTHTCYAGQFIIYTWACKYSFRLNQGFGYHVNFTPTFTLDMHIFRKGRMLRSPHFKIYYLKSLRDLWSLGYLFGTKRDRVAMLKQAREPFLLGKHYQYTFGCEDLRVQV